MLSYGSTWAGPKSAVKKALNKDVVLGAGWSRGVVPSGWAAHWLSFEPSFTSKKAKDSSWEKTVEEFNQLSIGPSLMEEEKWQLGELLCRYQDVFAFTLGELGNLNIMQHVIEMGIPNQCMFLAGVSPAVQEIICNELQSMHTTTPVVYILARALIVPLSSW